MLDAPGELAGLRSITPQDHSALQDAAVSANLSCSNLYFPYLYFSGQRPDRRLLIEDIDGSLVIYVARERDAALSLSLHVPPIPFSATALDRAVERVRDTNRHRRVRIKYLEQPMLAEIARAGGTCRMAGEEFL